MKRLSCHQTSFNDRLTMVGRYLGRTKKRGSGQLAMALVAPSTWMKLVPNKQSLSVPTSRVSTSSITTLNYGQSLKSFESTAQVQGAGMSYH